jgi:hypothetical protein
LDDRASTLARQVLVDRFRTTNLRLAPVPSVGVNAAAFPQEDMLLVMRRETMDRTTSNLTIHSSTTDPTRINRIFVQMMDMPEFRSALDAWTRSEGLMLQPAVVGDNATTTIYSASAAAVASTDTSCNGDTAGTDEPVEEETPSLPSLANNQSQTMDIDDLLAISGL